MSSSVKLFKELGISDLLINVSKPIIIADNIRTPENVGMILRLAANIDAVATYFIIDENINFKQHKINRTSSGASSKVNWAFISKDKIKSTIPNDYSIVAIETSSNSKSIFSFNFPDKVVFLVGSEVHGISEDILKLSHYEVFIPVPGKISSLNVTHALSIAIFEWLRQVME